MKKLLLLLLLSPLAIQAQQAAPAQSQRYYVLLYTTGPGWDTTKAPQAQTSFGAHSRHLARLRQAGTSVLGARYHDTGMLIIRAPNEAAVQSIIAADSSVTSRTFQVRYYETRFFQKGCIE